MEEESLLKDTVQTCVIWRWNGNYSLGGKEHTVLYRIKLFCLHFAGGQIMKCVPFDFKIHYLINVVTRCLPFKMPPNHCPSFFIVCCMLGQCSLGKILQKTMRPTFNFTVVL